MDMQPIPGFSGPFVSLHFHEAKNISARPIELKFLSHFGGDFIAAMWRDQSIDQSSNCNGLRNSFLVKSKITGFNESPLDTPENRLSTKNKQFATLSATESECLRLTLD